MMTFIIKRLPPIVTALLAAVSLVSWGGAYYHLAVYADEHNASMIGMLGGEGWLYLFAAVPVLLLVIIVMAVLGSFRKS